MKVNPYDKRPTKNAKKAFSKTEKSVDAVAKDTNKTRRKDTLLPLANAVKKKSAPRRMK
jgi:hypothetical protein